jgi:hypothetical protein
MNREFVRMCGVSKFIGTNEENPQSPQNKQSRS